MIDRCAGILIPLFSLRSIHDLGRGEFGGLVPMAQMAVAMGHRLLQLLPIDELAPGETSPYDAMSVFAIDPIYLTLDFLPGISATDCERARAEFRNSGKPVEQTKLRRFKGELLLDSFEYFKSGVDPALHKCYAQFAKVERGWLDDYALFRVLKDRFQWAEWQTWPPPLRNREPAALADVSTALVEQIAMVKYVQFLAHRQWQELRNQLKPLAVLLGGDLAFSPGRESAEVWAHQELFDLSRAVGAPPDAFSVVGQRWGLPMPDWEQMRADNFDFLRRRVRHARELYDVLRIDHVVGLYRTWGYACAGESGGEFDPRTEAAQRAQGEAIMEIVLAEAGPMQIVAEDLGLIPQFVRETLATLSIPGYKVLRWEKQNTPAADRRFVNPADYPKLSLATTGTHDTDTLVGWWASISQGERRHLIEAMGLPADIGPISDVLDERQLDAILEWVYTAPSQLVVTPVQDLFGWDVRINLPGITCDANWSWRLPFDLESAMADPLVRKRVGRIRALCEKTRRCGSLRP